MFQYFDINEIFKVNFIRYKQLYKMYVCKNPENTTTDKNRLNSGHNKGNTRVINRQFTKIYTKID